MTTNARHQNHSLDIGVQVKVFARNETLGSSVRIEDVFDLVPSGTGTIPVFASKDREFPKVAATDGPRRLRGGTSHTDVHVGVASPCLYIGAFGSE